VRIISAWTIEETCVNDDERLNHWNVYIGLGKECYVGYTEDY